jgi:hypothetical protein
MARWLVILPLLFVVGCGSSEEGTSVTGVLQATGGPSGTPPMPLRGQITFTDGSDTVVAKTDGAGRYGVSLPHGRYTVEGTSPAWVGSCTGPELLVGDKTVERNVTCPRK